MNITTRSLAGPSAGQLEFDQLDAMLQSLARALPRTEHPWWGRQSTLFAASVLKDALRTRLRTVHDHRFAETRYRDLFNSIYWCLPFRPVIAGSVFVDIGCGPWNPWGTSLLLLMLGARRCYAFDLEPAADPARAARGLADLAATFLLDPKGIVGDYPVSREEILRNLGGFDFAKLKAGDPDGIDRTRLVHAPRDASAMPLRDGEADVLMSNAFFEHVEDVDAVVAEMKRVTRPGGLHVHGIDSTDHRRYEDPRIDPLEYLTDRAPVHYYLASPGPAGSGHWMNRLRPCQFEDIFARHGLETVAFHPWVKVELSPARIARFAEPFRSMRSEQLATASGQFLLRHRGDAGAGDQRRTR
jgi:SAM-dependent methyltransferase